MPFQLPTLKELIVRTQGAFRANLKNSDAVLWPNNVAVAAKVMAGAVWEPFSFLSYISRQHIKHLAEGQWLERHAFDYGLARLAPSYAEGRIVLSGDVGVTVPAGLTLKRADGFTYTTISSGITNGDGEATVTVRATATGKAGNALPGVTVALASPFDRIETEGVVAATGIGGGADLESDDSLRERLLFRLRNPPHGGAAHDYIIWAREVAGVTRVFVDPVSVTNGRQTVGIWFLMDDTYANGIPQAADVARVAAYIDALRPAGALIEIGAPIAVPVNITIDGLVPDSLTVREAVKAELRELFAKRMDVSTVTRPFTVHISKIWEAISVATGEDSHTLVAPAEDVALDTGRIATLGTVTFT